MGRTRAKTNATRDEKLNKISLSITNMKTHTSKQKQDTLKRRTTQRQQSLAANRVGGSSIIVHAPKRTNSISSLTSTNSIVSDEHSKDSHTIPSPSPLLPPSVINSTKLVSHTPSPTPSTTSPFTESHPQQRQPPAAVSPAEATATDEKPSMAELTANAIETLNAGLLSRFNRTFANNRKIFMITERSDGAKDSLGKANVPKRKMFLILEDKPKSSGEPSHDSDFNNKRMTLFTDKEGVSAAEIQDLLPFLIDRIKARIESDSASNATKAAGSPTNGNGLNKNGILLNGNQENLHFGAMNAAANSNGYSEKVPLTLPPKKNRNKIVNAALGTAGLADFNIINNNNNSNNNINNASHEKNGQLEISVVPNTEKDTGSNVSTSVWTLNNNTGQLKPANLHAHEPREPYDPMEGNRTQKPAHYTTTQVHNQNGPITTATYKNNTKNYNNNNNNTNNYCSSERMKNKERRGATTVIVNPSRSPATKLNGATNPKTYDNSRESGLNNGGGGDENNLKQRNINLSPDFLFLMKMLPKLEGIPEPTKTYVKNYIEEAIEQNTERQ